MARVTPEGKIKKKCREMLDSFPQKHVFHYVAAQGAFSPNGVSDLIACVVGQFVAIELKKPGGKPTKLQVIFMRSVEKANGFSFVIDSEESIEELKLWIQQQISNSRTE